ncbi:MAG TPA: hypothetical protein VD905_14565 [Flavobacteriales bacterium]|nr:hypothetical protein [Flavobacteriales bacterium]
MRLYFFIILVLVLLEPIEAQQNKGTIKVRKAKNIKGLFVLEESSYYKEKLYLRFFDNNEAVFLRAAISPEKAKDSTAKLLYTYRKSPCSYRVVNDSVFVEGAENKVPFTYCGVFKNNTLSVRKISQARQSKVIFKKLM